MLRSVRESANLRENTTFLHPEDLPVRKWLVCVKQTVSMSKFVYGFLIFVRNV